MRQKNKQRSARVQLSISKNVDRILEEVAEIGILGKTKTEVATSIVTDWIWSNEDRLLRQDISLNGEPRRKTKHTKSGRP